ncbi:MAG: phosphoribosyltransferase family protein [Patescibacteria group bacterium]
MSFIARLCTTVSDAVFPPRCVACDTLPSDPRDRYLCRACAGRIPVHSSGQCIGCAHTTPRGTACPTCAPAWNIHALYAATHFQHPTVRAALHAYKYGCIEDLHQPLGRLALRALKRISRAHNPFEHNPLIVPVPLHTRRLNWRGFNQAEHIAHTIANATQQTFEPIALVRNHHSEAQVRHSRTERFLSVQNLFSCTNPSLVKGKDVLLVDDVCTTGATLDACATALRAAGASTVSAFVIAREV